MCNYVLLFCDYLIALQLTPGSAVVMHLVMREQLPEPTNQGAVVIFVFFSMTFCNFLVSSFIDNS